MDGEGKDGPLNATTCLPGSSSKTPEFIWSLGSLNFLGGFLVCKVLLKDETQVKCC